MLTALKTAYDCPNVDTIILFSDGEPYDHKWPRQGWSDSLEDKGRTQDREKVAKPQRQQELVMIKQAKERRIRITRSNQNPDLLAYIRTQAAEDQPYWQNSPRRFTQPRGLLLRIYWSKDHVRRLWPGRPVPDWCRAVIRDRLRPPSRYHQHTLRGLLAWEVCVQTVRLLMEDHGAQLPAQPAPAQLRRLTASLDQLVEGASDFAGGWRSLLLSRPVRR